MIATQQPNADPLVVSFDSGEQPWQMTAGVISKLEISSSSSGGSSSDDSSDDDDSVAPKYFDDPVKERGSSVCTASTGLSTTASSLSDEDDAEDSSSISSDNEDEIDVDELMERLASQRSLPEAAAEAAEAASEQEPEADPKQAPEAAPEQAPEAAPAEEDEAPEPTRFRNHRSSIILKEDELPKQSVAVPPRTLPRGKRSSIKLSSLQQDILVSDRRTSWKQLPKPDMEKIKRAVSCPTYISEEEKVEPRTQMSVRFHDIQIRSYAQTIGDNPSVSYGPPICLDWEYEELKPVLVDDYEEKRGDRRMLKQMGLSYYQRMALLQKGFGYTEAEIKQAQKTANKDKFKRAVTKYFLPYQMLEDAAESSVRKTKRLLQRRRQTTV